MLGAGLEPASPCGRLILSQLRLPISPPEHILNNLLEVQGGIEPPHNRFADDRVTISPLHQNYLEISN